jgi:hypothetical protein
MAKSKSKGGKVNAENISGAKVPRKGLSDETTGKALGSRDIRSVGGPRFNYVRSGG